MQQENIKQQQKNKNMWYFIYFIYVVYWQKTHENSNVKK